MLFNPDPSKPAQKVLFSRKKKVQIPQATSLNNIQVERASHYKHLGILLDEKLNFKQYVNTAILKKKKQDYICNKKTWTYLATEILMIKYKAFLRHLIDYGDIIYD